MPGLWHFFGLSAADLGSKQGVCLTTWLPLVAVGLICSLASPDAHSADPWGSRSSDGGAPSGPDSSWLGSPSGSGHFRRTTRWQPVRSSSRKHPSGQSSSLRASSTADSRQEGSGQGVSTSARPADQIPQVPSIQEASQSTAESFRLGTEPAQQHRAMPSGDPRPPRVRPHSAYYQSSFYYADPQVAPHAGGHRPTSDQTWSKAWDVAMRRWFGQPGQFREGEEPPLTDQPLEPPQPGTAPPSVVPPGMMSPGMMSPGMMSPGTAPPGMMSPGMMSPEGQGPLPPGILPGDVPPGGVVVDGPDVIQSQQVPRYPDHHGPHGHGPPGHTSEGFEEGITIGESVEGFGQCHCDGGHCDGGHCGEGYYSGGYPGECHSGGCPIGCEHGYQEHPGGGWIAGDFGRWGRSNCRVCEGWFWAQDLTLFAGVQAFEGPLDGGLNGNFGFHYGVNYAFPLWHKFGIGMQVGGMVAQSNLRGGTPAVFANGNQIVQPGDDRNQYFVTAGLFRRAYCGTCGWQYGVVFDWQHDNYFEDITFQQLRVELSRRFWGPHEIGFWGAFGLNEQEVADFFGEDEQDEVEQVRQYLAFYRYHYHSGDEGRIFGGVTEQGDGLVGGDAYFVISDFSGFEVYFNYLIPREDTTDDLVDREAWALGFNYVIYPGRTGSVATRSRYRPLFPVANNSNFFVRR